MYFKIASLPRKYKVLIILLSDLFLIPLALWSAISLRLGAMYLPVDKANLFFIFLPLVTIFLFYRIGLYRIVIRYLDEKIIFTIFLGVSISALFLTTIIFLAKIEGVPRSSIIIYWVICVIYITLSRYLARGIIRQFERNVNVRKQKVAIYGAGRAGLQTALAMINSNEYHPILFFDDNKDLQGTSIAGIRIFAADEAENILEEHDCHQLVLAIPSISLNKRKVLIKKFENKNIQLKIIPGLSEIVGNQINIENIREVGIEDLLGRDPVPAIETLIEKDIQRKVILVTGAGGSIGSELCRQILKRNPVKLILLEVNEYSLYQIERELLSYTHEVEIVPILNSVLNTQTIKSLIQSEKVDIIYHAAAYKHVPLVEHNIISGVINNVFGTKSVLDAAVDTSVKKIILISTDKAVRPTNIMGATKRVSELVFQAYATRIKINLSMVRFGNVLGSSGSVIPLFKEQIKKGGPVTVTHPEITRYFMTIPEAAELVLQAGGMSQSGDLFVLDMGEPVKIIDLAKKMILLSGYTIRDKDNYEGEVEIKFTGLRPGEKLYEELLISNESVSTEHPRILKAREEFIAYDILEAKLQELKKNCEENNSVAAKTIVKELVANFMENSQA